MSQQELLKSVVQALAEASIEYMLTGSAASSLQGEPRLSHDIDVVVAIDRESASKLAESFLPPRFYLSEQSILAAIEKMGVFNLIDGTTGDKVDFWLLTDEPFDRMRFSRRVTEDVMGMRLSVSTPEDTILAKLRWGNISGGSEKQFTDALRVYEVQYGTLDIEYLHDWAKKIGVDDLLKRIEVEAETIEHD